MEKHASEFQNVTVNLGGKLSNKIKKDFIAGVHFNVFVKLKSDKKSEQVELQITDFFRIF